MIDTRRHLKRSALNAVMRKDCQKTRVAAGSPARFLQPFRWNSIVSWTRWSWWKWREVMDSEYILKIDSHDLLKDWNGYDVWVKNDKAESRMMPSMWGQNNWKDGVPIYWDREDDKRNTFGGKIRSSFLAMVGVKCLLDIQVDMSNRQLNRQV